MALRIYGRMSKRERGERHGKRAGERDRVILTGGVKKSVGVLTISFIFYVGFCRRSKITRQRPRLPTIPDDDRALMRLYQLPREF